MDAIEVVIGIPTVCNFYWKSCPFSFLDKPYQCFTMSDLRILRQMRLRMNLDFIKRRTLGQCRNNFKLVSRNVQEMRKNLFSFALHLKKRSKAASMKKNLKKKNSSLWTAPSQRRVLPTWKTKLSYKCQANNLNFVFSKQKNFFVKCFWI